MSVHTTEPDTADRPAGGRPPVDPHALERPPFLRSRCFIALLLAGALLLTGVMQALVRHQRENVIYSDGLRPRTASRLAGLDTFALGLILGGLRGPLVMFLWSNVEKQKMDRNLEGIDTQIELIRMLQPEFDSVHIFQIWNKAYNLSVQMASMPNKYATILDAVDYGRSVLQERPDNVNLLVSLGDVYFNKLGDSSEKRYYAMRMRRETLPHADMPRIPRGQRGWRRTQHDVVLDADGLILPEYLRPRMDLRGYNGAEYQFLERYNAPEIGGFRYGLPPIAIGYNYYKRGAALTIATGRTHLQLSEPVIHSRAGIILKKWSEQELELGRRHEILALGQQEKDEREDLETITSALPPDAPFIEDRQRAADLVDRAIFAYGRSALVAVHAMEDYHQHIEQYGGPAAIRAAAATYSSHIANAEALSVLALADRDYLRAIAAGAGLASADNVAELKAAAAENYRKASDLFHRLAFRYYTDPDAAAVVFPEVTGRIMGEALSRAELAKIDPKAYPALRQGLRDYFGASDRWDPNHWEMVEFDAFIARATQRLEVLSR
jgi:hypothetical protein